MSEIAAWQGEFGDQYIRRNAGNDIAARGKLWHEILMSLDEWPDSVLEIGAGSGRNLKALDDLEFPDLTRLLIGIEPNAKARSMLKENGYSAFDGTAANPGRTADLVFTSGVLIHIPPDELMAACQGIYDAAERYIVSIEYFAAEPEEKAYRGRKLWKRDFGAFWLDNFDLKPLGCGFAWKRMTGLDNLIWWAFAK